MLTWATVQEQFRKHRYPCLVIAFACVVFLGAGFYGLGAPFVFGHLGYHGGEYATRAKHTLHNGTFLPVNVPGHSYPGNAALYLHHPVLTHHLVTVGFLILGEHEFVVRLAALFAAFVMSAAFCAVLWKYEGPWPAALGSLLFVLIPIHLWYNQHIDPGFPGMACLLIFFYYYFQFIETEKLKHAFYALVALALSCGFDWFPYLVSVPVGLHLLYHAFQKRGRRVGFIPLYGLALLLPLAFHFLMVLKAGHWAEMKSGYSARTHPMNAAIYYKRIFVYAQSYFGMPLFGITAAWLALFFTKLLRGKTKPLDLMGVGFVAGLAFYVYWFKDGVMTHGYRLMYGAVPAAWATIDISLQLADRVKRWIANSRPDIIFALACLLIIGLTLPYSWTGLIESRAHQGIPDWKTFNPYIERSAFAKSLQTASKPEDKLYIHRLFPVDRMELAFYMDRDQVRGFDLTRAYTLKPEERAKALLVFPRQGLHPQEEAALAELRKQYAYAQFETFAWLDMRQERAETQIRTLLQPVPGQRTAWDRYINGPYPWPEVIGR